MDYMQGGGLVVAGELNIGIYGKRGGGTMSLWISSWRKDSVGGSRFAEEVDMSLSEEGQPVPFASRSFE